MWTISKENLEQILKIESKHLKRRFWVKIFKLIDFRQRIIFEVGKINTLEHIGIRKKIA